MNETVFMEQMNMDDYVLSQKGLNKLLLRRITFVNLTKQSTVNHNVCLCLLLGFGDKTQFHDSLVWLKHNNNALSKDVVTLRELIVSTNGIKLLGGSQTYHSPNV